MRTELGKEQLDINYIDQVDYSNEFKGSKGGDMIKIASDENMALYDDEYEVLINRTEELCTRIDLLINKLDLIDKQIQGKRIIEIKETK